MSGLPQWAIISLRLIHVLSGVFWVGAAIMIARFLLPSLIAAGPGGAAVMREISQQRKLPTVMNVVGGLTVLSGLTMYIAFSMGSHGAFGRSRMGMVLGLGAVLSLVTMVTGGIFTRPIGVRMGALGAEMAARNGPPTDEQRAEMARLQARLRKLATVNAILLGLAAATMAVARYL